MYAIITFQKLKIMKHFFYLITVLLFSNFAKGQNYTLEYSFKDMLGNKNNAQLIISGDESVFKVDSDLLSKDSMNESASNGTELVVKRINSDSLSTFSYSTRDSIFVRIPYTQGREEEFIYNFETQKLNWNITGETQEINGYTCQKANLDLHGRFYHVWFTTEIPIKFGPFRLNGLPGMIVKVKVSLSSEDKRGRSWSLLTVKNQIDEEVFDFYKQFFVENEVMNYNTYQEKASEAMLDLKRQKLAKTAALKAEWAKRDGYESNAYVEYGPDFFTGYLFDIPKGIREKLDKLN